MHDRDDLTWATGHAALDEIFCLTFIKAVDVTEALRRIGGYPDTVGTRTLLDIGHLHNFDNGYPTVALALPLGAWTVVFEPGGHEGCHLLDAVSHGTEAVSVLRHDYASPTFGYAVAGELVTQFDPTFPTSRRGTDPDRLLPLMREVGFVEDDEDGQFDGAIALSLCLAERITGVLPTADALTGPLTSAHFDPWFSTSRKPAAGRPDRSGPVDAFAEVRRITALHGLTDTPGLADALATAERGEPVVVTPDSELGRHVRNWIIEADRASWSLNDHGGRGRMDDAQRNRGYDLGWLKRALGSALQSPDAAG